MNIETISSDTTLFEADMASLTLEFPLLPRLPQEDMFDDGDEDVTVISKIENINSLISELNIKRKFARKHLEKWVEQAYTMEIERLIKQRSLIISESVEE